MIAAVRVALQLLLNLKRKPLHAAERMLRCGPPRSTPAPSSASGSSISLQNVQNPSKAHRRRPRCRRARSSRSQARCSMTPDFALAVRSAPSHAANVLAASGPRRALHDIAPISTGSKIEPSLPFGSAVRACLRHVKSRLCATPYRRATSHTTAPGISVSSTIREPSRPCSNAVGARPREPSHPSLRDLKASSKVTPFATDALTARRPPPDGYEPDGVTDDRRRELVARKRDRHASIIPIDRASTTTA